MATSSTASFAFESVSIPSAEILDSGVVYYTVGVRPSAGDGWYVVKRYSQFEHLAHTLHNEFLGAKLPVLPPKKIKILQNHSSSAFIEERRILLDNFLSRLLSIEEVCQSPTLKAFLTSNRQSSKVYTSEDDDKYEFPEDQEVRDIQVPQAKVMADHVLYQVHCSSVPAEHRNSEHRWVSLKRYNDLVQMIKAVKADLSRTHPSIAQNLPPPPPRKSRVFHDHADPAFVEQRRVLLEKYLGKLLRIEAVANNEHFLKFCAVPGYTSV